MLNKKILICDDDEGILDMLELVFEDAGIDVIAVGNSLNVKAEIEKQNPDLVLLDLWMPLLSGDQVLKSIRNNPTTSEMPVIIISASREGKEIALNARATAFMAKPFDLDELINLVKTHMS